MGRIVAIGGGEIGRPGTDLETLKIDRSIIELCGKNSPRVLFIPTASNDSKAYIETFKALYRDKLGCRVSVLPLNNHSGYEELESLIASQDIIYVGLTTLPIMK